MTPFDLALARRWRAAPGFRWLRCLPALHMLREVSGDPLVSARFVHSMDEWHVLATRTDDAGHPKERAVGWGPTELAAIVAAMEAQR